MRILLHMTIVVPEVQLARNTSFPTHLRCARLTLYSTFKNLTGTHAYAAILTCLLATAAFRFAAGFATQYGLLRALLLLPFVHLAFGLGLVSVTVTAKWALLPNFAEGQSVQLWSSDFARWWFVNRLVDITNTLYMRQFRGTVLLNWYLKLLVSQSLPLVGPAASSTSAP